MSFDKVETAIILAAGRSERFGAENKLLAPWRGRPLVSHVIDAASQSALRQIFLVTGQDGDAIAALAPHPKIQRVHNGAFEHGLASSLQAGLRAAPDEAVLILLGDMPLVTSALINEIAGAWREDAYALIPTHNGQAGNPVILSRAARADAQSLVGDSGARALFKGRVDLIHLPVSDPAILRDLDLASDFTAD